MAAGTRTKAAAEKLARQTAGDYSQLAKAQDAPQPDSRMYGVFQPQFAASLASDAADPFYGALAQAALRHEAENEVERYSQQLEASRQAQLQLQNMAGRYGVIGKAIEKSPDQAFMGMLSGVDENGIPIYNPDLVARQNLNTQNTADADLAATYAGANKDNASAGLFIDPAVAAARDTPVDAQAPMPAYGVIAGPGGTYMTPAEAETVRHNQATEANDRITANAAATRAARGGGDGTVKVEFTPGMFGLPPQVKYRGTPSAVAPYMQGQGEGQTAAAGTGLSKVVSDVANRPGYKGEIKGNQFVVTAPSGKTATYDLNGNRVQ